jgi:putative endonuclease
VYIIECVNGSYYTGIARDVKKRYSAHVSGTACRYTKSFPPLRLLCAWRIEGGRSLAQKVEAMVKSLSRGEKEVLVCNPQSLTGMALAHLGREVIIVPLDPPGAGV